MTTPREEELTNKLREILATDKPQKSVLDAIDELNVLTMSLEGVGMLITHLGGQIKKVSEGLHKSERPFGKRRLFGVIEAYCQGKSTDTQGALADMIEKATDLGFTDWKKTADFNGFVMATTNNQDASTQT